MVLIDFMQNLDLRAGIVLVHATVGGTLHVALWYNRNKAKENKFSFYLAILVWYMSLARIISAFCQVYLVEGIKDVQKTVILKRCVSFL